MSPGSTLKTLRHICRLRSGYQTLCEPATFRRYNPSVVDDPRELYALPLEDFTAARNDLAARMRDRGDRDEATRIGKLKRPTVAAWAVNQLARQDAADLERLFDLRAELEAAAAAPDLRRLAQERRHLLSHLAERGRAILKEGGHPTSSSTTDKISQTLMAGDTEEDRRHILEGTLSKELAPAGVGVFGTIALGSEAEGTEEPEPEVDPKIARLENELQESAAESERLERIALDTETAAQAARQAADDARKTEERLRARLEKARV